MNLETKDTTKRFGPFFFNGEENAVPFSYKAYVIKAFIKKKKKRRAYIFLCKKTLFPS